MKNNLLVFVIFGLLLLGGAWTCLAAPPDNSPATMPPALDELIFEALAHSAELRALEARIAAAEALVSPAGALPDPMFSVGLKNIPVDHPTSLDRDMMSGLEFMLSQDYMRASKRRLMRRAQTAEAAMLHAAYTNLRNDLIRRTKRAYFDLQYLDEGVRIAARNQTLAQEMLTIAEAKYATGKTMQQSVFEAQLRLSQMLDMTISMQKERAMALARLNRLLYREPAQPLAALPPPAFAPAQLDAAQLALQLKEFNPQLREMQARLAERQEMAALAKENLAPDYMLSFGYMLRQPLAMMPDSGGDMFSLSVGINLPWVNRRQKADKEIEAAQAETFASQADLEAMDNELSAMLEEMLVDLSRIDQQLRLLETGLLPQARGAFDSSRAAYAAGGGEFLHLLDNQMNLYQLQLSRANLLTDYARTLAEIDYLTGSPSAAKGDYND